MGKNCYENLFRDVFSDSNIILFIPNINSVRVFINGQEERTCFRNNEEWIVGDYENEIEDNLKLFYYRGLKEWNNEKGYLTDTCLTAQDKYKAYLDYFRIEY